MHHFNTQRRIWLATIVAAFGLASQAATAADWSSDNVQLLLGNRYVEPGVPEKAKKVFLQYEHVNGYRYGSIYFYVQALKHGDEVTSSGQKQSPMEFFSEFQHSLSLGKVRGTPIGFGPVKDVGIGTGLAIGSTSDSFGFQTRAYYAGPDFDFDLGKKGWSRLSVAAYMDNSHTNFGTPVLHRKLTYRIAQAWSYELGQIGQIPVKFEGFWKVIGSPGKSAFTGERLPLTAMFEPKLMFDVGSLFMEKKGTGYAGIEYEWWHNKFNDKTLQQKQPRLIFKWEL